MRHQGRPLHGLSAQLLRRAFAIEIANMAISADPVEVPAFVTVELRHMTRGMSRDDCIRLVGHLAMLVRLFAAEVPVGRRDQMLAELDDFDRIAFGNREG